MTGAAPKVAAADAYVELVRKVAHTIARGLPRHVEARELYGAGTLGLMDALERYEAGRGVPFEAYAALRIRGTILDELRKRDWVPRGVRQRIRAGEEHAPVMLEVGAKGLELVDAREGALDTLVAFAEAGAVVAALKALPARERHVMERYVLDGWKLKEIGVELGLTECRICQLHGAAVERMRAHVDAQLGAA